ncbi:MAG: hypothetical protein ACD_16C00213G0015 [uncultured bacterium]|nr:MAG: hypothetical protein ACD_16C00213G0015 [uncultured bacterium]OFW69784.1 MAG: hypothetical protein A2X70_03505 [Alphaproteobacteria bacterium GWC2_42_16]OFW74384.1 MAG: hypothetical protein A2Z80_05145 [Alphaproteobacteria bacterium GWA2_41_27]OFW82518.1 MAG: hypothetical protein A3E50_06830 [Alphaproteobacteria bacterium RIFCSPHIGHO2_12_FULL_42_100]OFW85106.1 MAG: hypothetical protein A2W06_03765 [Alphaproteobacteria bacterium RBG_16_42_14]OFW91628.1 MAG: hypothetical protein A2W46_060
MKNPHIVLGLLIASSTVVIADCPTVDEVVTALTSATADPKVTDIIKSGNIKTDRAFLHYGMKSSFTLDASDLSKGCEYSVEGTKILTIMPSTSSAAENKS